MKLMWQRRWEKIWGRNEKAKYPTRGDEIKNLLSKGMKKIKSPMSGVKCPTMLIGNFAI
jgi:hypothetical protein